MGKKAELLAPAGSPEGLYGALYAGADAVYLGGTRFGARAYADNFTQEELTAGIRYAHLFGRRIYLTVNTLMKEPELAELCDYLRPFYEAGLDGVIVQDFGALSVIRRNFPELELHASTQMTITGSAGAQWLRGQGVSRVVPARELSLKEIRRMKADTGLEIETFIHGAMCYCYSGQCLFSSMLGGRSGNRGRCAQPCRLPYRVGHGREITPECYPLSLKDLCTIEKLPELIEAGIDSFKIEGRMKKPEYAAGVTAIYRKYIDKYYKLKSEGKGLNSPDFTWKIAKQDLSALSRLYIRSERQDGYYFRRSGREMITLESPAYSACDEAFLQQERDRYLTENRMKHPTEVQAVFVVGKPAAVTLKTTISGRTLTAHAVGGPVEPAQKQPVTEEQVRRQLAKLGDTVLEAERFDLRVSENAFYSLKEINELRRRAAAELEERIAEAYGLPLHREFHKASMPAECCRNYTSAGSLRTLRLFISTPEQLSAVTDCLKQETGPVRTERIYLDADLADTMGTDGLRHLDAQLSQRRPELVLSLPHILRNEDQEFLERILRTAHAEADGRRLIGGIQVRNIDGLGFLRAAGYGGTAQEHIYADASFYVWNTETIRTADGLDGFCLPYELTAGEQHALICGSRIPCEKIFYGRIPMMVTANCAALTTDGCRKGSDELYFLRDRYQKQFPVARNCKHCYNVIYNSLPLSLHREWSKWIGCAAARLNFTVEDAGETGEILQFYQNGCNGDFPGGEYTTGHEKKGTE